MMDTDNCGKGIVGQILGTSTAQVILALTTANSLSSERHLSECLIYLDPRFAKPLPERLDMQEIDGRV